MIGYYNVDELAALGFASVGENVKISKTATIYNLNRVHIGNNVRIDNFCVLAVSGGAWLRIGNYVQISAYCFMNGLGDITLEDFVTLAPGVRLFSSSDDYSGECLTNALVPEPFRRTESAPIMLRKHTIIGTSSSVLPGCELAEGTAVGAYSLVKGGSRPFTIIAGVPAVEKKERSRQLLDEERRFNARNRDSS